MPRRMSYEINYFHYLFIYFCVGDVALCWMLGLHLAPHLLYFFFFFFFLSRGKLIRAFSAFFFFFKKY